MDGFIYDGYWCSSPDDDWKEDTSMKWLELLDDSDGGKSASDHHRSLRSYQQLATVLTKQGRRREAEEILIEMEEKSGKHGKFLSFILKHGIGYGYRPINALVFALIFIIYGTLIFQQGDRQKVFYPTNFEASKKPEYPSFCPFAFSAETFFPVLGVDLGMKKIGKLKTKQSFLLDR